MEHAREDRAHQMDDVEEAGAQERDHHDVDERKWAAHDRGHDKGEDQAKRRAHGNADDHHERLLHVVDVGGEARDERAGAELIDVGEAEALDVVEHVATQVLGKATAGIRAGDACRGTENQRHDGQAAQDASRFDQALHGGADLDLIDQACRKEWDHHFACNLAQHQERCGDGRLLVIADASRKGFNHRVPPRSRGFFRACRQAAVAPRA